MTTQQFPDDGVIDKIRKLLDLGNSAGEGTSEHRVNEAAAALAKASELLQRYNLDLSVIEAAREQEAQHPLGDVTHANVSVPKVKVRGRQYHADTRSEWVSGLAYLIGKANFCMTLVGNRGESLTFIGRARNVEAAEYMFLSVTAQLEMFATHATRKYRLALLEEYGTLEKAFRRRCAPEVKFRRSWLIGAVVTISEALREIIRKFELEQNGMTGRELMIFNAVENQEYADQLPFFTKGEAKVKKSDLDMVGFVTGKIEGKDIGLATGAIAGAVDRKAKK